MRSRLDLWRRHWKLWLVPLVFLVVNLGVLGIHRLIFAGQFRLLEQDLAREIGQRDALLEQRRQVETLVGRAQRNHDRIQELYDQHFSTRRQRLTQVISEIKRLAREAGLDPNAISYPEENIEDYNLVEKSFVFPVDGTYAGLRKFIRLLETSESFLTLKRINLSEGGDGPRLRINLEISTLFAREPGADPKRRRVRS